MLVSLAWLASVAAAPAFGQDCNNNGIPDATDIANVVIADSAAEFSDTQGSNGWYYGYYVAPFNSASFQLLTVYGPDSDFSSINTWHLQKGSGGFYTAIGQTQVHPNGPVSTGGRQNVGHWVCRRWISTHSGSVTLAGHVAKLSAAGCGGCDGERARILLNGVEIWNQFIAQTNAAGVDFNLPVTISVGSIIDFVIDPIGNDGQDFTSFTAVVRGGGDCNNNGILDSCDIAATTSVDCNGDNVPDECQPNTDCNNNSVRDICEAATIGDCNSNGVLDPCDIAAGAMDMDYNGVLDSCTFPLNYERVKPCGRLYLAFTGGIDGIRVRRRNGAAVTTLQSGAINYIGGQLTFDSDRNLLVTDWNQDRVLVIARDGTLVRTISGGSLDGPHGIAMTPAGTIAVSSYLNHGVKFYTLSGAYLGNLSHSIGTQHPQCLAYDRSGNLYVGCRNDGNTGHVAKFNPLNQFVSYIGQGTFAPHPLDMAFDADENLYVTTPGMIRKFNSSGTLVQTITQAGLDPKGISIDETGKLWVTNLTNRSIFRFTPAGVYIDTINIDLGAGAPAALALYGIAIDVKPDGDCNNNAVGDACDIDVGAVDCDFDGLIDSCQLAGNDCNNNGVLDRCESGDCNNNGIRDVCDIVAGATDCNANGLPDTCELQGPLNIPGSTVSPINGRRYKLSAPNTWTAAEAEAVSLGGHLTTVRNAAENQWLLNFVLANSTANRAWIGFNDVASEGSFAWISASPVTYTNWYPGEPNNSGNEDWVDMACRVFTPGTWIDTSGNSSQPGVMEFPLVTDCNSNGILDSCDIVSGTSGDCDANGVPDECQPNTDCDNNGVRDLCEAAGRADCDGDGVTNYCQIAAGATDCDGDWIPDNCEALAGDFSLQFDGSNDMVRVPRSATLEPTQELTVECWVRPNATGPQHSRILRMKVSNGFILAWQQSGDQRVQLRIDGATGGTIAAKDTVPTSTYFGGWHHIAGTYSASGNFTRLYVDGVLKASANAVGTLQYSDAELHIGNSIYGNEAFDGQIDELRIWTVAKTQAQIAANMNVSFSGPQAGLVGYWKMDAGAGQSLVDSSGRGNHGQRGNDALPAGDTADPAWMQVNGVLPGPNDCNGNQVPDSCDIAAATVTDCNANNVPDSCESDCNNNGIADACDIAGGTVPDCNGNGIPDACDIAAGTSTDVNTNGVPDSCEPDIRLIPVISIINPTSTSEIRSVQPSSINAVSRGTRYYIEVWASDVGSTNTGLTGAYTDVNFCSQTTATAMFHGGIFNVFPAGTIQSTKVDEFGGSALPNGGGIAPQWVRVGWIEMNAGTESAGCNVSLTPGAGGVAAFNRGLINPALITFGAVSLVITPPAKTYDLDNNTNINVGDLSLFAGSWLTTVPPGNTAHDFDCDDAVGVSDLSWFATGWNKSVTDPTILYPPCDGGGGGWGPGEEPGEQPTDIAFKIAVLNAPSSSDNRITVPTSIVNINEGQQYYVEVWASDIGDINTGITSAYLDLMLPPTAAAVISINHNGIFTVFPSGAEDEGKIDELGGSHLLADAGVEPIWSRVATVRLFADANRPLKVFSLLPSTTGVAAYGRGGVSWGAIELDTVSIGTPGLGDIDADGDVDQADMPLFINVLLGLDTNPGHITRSDMNADTFANGKDVQGFVAELTGG